MGIVNRSLDVSEKKVVKVLERGAVGTGETLMAFSAPFPCKVRDVYAGAQGLSGSPVVAFQVHRVAAAGATAIGGVAATLALQALGTSGMIQASLAVSGSSFLLMEAGDVMVLSSGGTNAAVEQLLVEVTIEKLQDIVSHYGDAS